MNGTPLPKLSKRSKLTRTSGFGSFGTFGRGVPRVRVSSKRKAP